MWTWCSAQESVDPGAIKCPEWARSDGSCESTVLYLYPGSQLLLAWPEMSRTAPQREAVKKGPGIDPRSSKGHAFPLSSVQFSCSVMSISSANPWIIVCQAPMAVGFPREEHWGGLPLPSQGIFPTQGSNPVPCLGR